MSGFQPLGSIRIDAAHTLEQTLGRYQSIRDGLPELIKNSKDHYARLGLAEKDERQIVVLFSENRRHLGVLDFGGAAAEDFEAWVEWSSRTASRADRASDIEAGHGNGGKAFMVRGCTTASFMCGHHGGKRTQMGFRNDDPALRYVAGYFEDDNGARIEGLPDARPHESLDALLRPLGAGVGALPGQARELFRRRQAYTIVVLRDVGDLVAAGSRAQVVKAAIEDIRSHAQAALTIETSTVWVMCGKEVLSGPLGVEPLPPKKGFETPWRFEVPEALADPDTGRRVKLATGDDPPGHLELHATEQHLRMSDRRKALNAVRVRNRRNVVSNWSVADLAPVWSSAYLYGTLFCPSLGAEHVAGADRQTLANVPLVRALRDWTAQRLNEAVDAIQRAEHERESGPERDKASTALQRLRDLMRGFLRQQRPGAGAGGPEGGGAGGRVKEFGERVDQVNLEDGKIAIALAVGARIPVRYTCWQVEADGKRLPVPPPPVSLLCDPAGAVSWEGRGVIIASAPGTATISLVTRPDGVTSNGVEVIAWDTASVDLKPPNRPVRQGERVQVRMVGHTPQGITVSDALYETSVDEADMGRLGRAGVFTAGGIAGVATLRVRFGPRPTDQATCQVIVSEERVERKGKGGGPDIPQILLCGQEAPGREDLAPEHRTQKGGANRPTIIDYEPFWRTPPEVVWVNDTSKESLWVRSGHGPSGVMGLNNPTFYNYLVLKCFEILQRLWVKQQVAEGEPLTYQDFVDRMSEAQMEMAAFLDDGFALVKTLVRGQKPGSG